MVLLIPTNDGSKDLSQESNLTGDTITLAQGLYSDLSGICERNSDTCEAANQIRIMFEHKIKTGASLLISYIEDNRQDTVVTGSIKAD